MKHKNNKNSNEKITESRSTIYNYYVDFVRKNKTGRENQPTHPKDEKYLF